MRGLLAWHVLATRPGLFNAYVIVDASVSWNHGQVVDEVEKALRSTVICPGVYLGLKAVFDDYQLPNRPDWTPGQVDEWDAR